MPLQPGAETRNDGSKKEDELGGKVGVTQSWVQNSNFYSGLSGYPNPKVPDTQRSSAPKWLLLHLMTMGKSLAFPQGQGEGPTNGVTHVCASYLAVKSWAA